MAGEAPYGVNGWDIDEFFRVLESFPASQQTRVTEFMAQHLPARPKVMIPGVLKELEGQWAGIYQFECGGPRRMLNEVNEEQRVVAIICLGNHPRWEKRRPVR